MDQMNVPPTHICDTGERRSNPIAGADAAGDLTTAAALRAEAGPEHPSERRFMFPDGLRAIAAVAVVLFHFGGYFALSGTLAGATVVTRATVTATGLGHLGVD